MRQLSEAELLVVSGGDMPPINIPIPPVELPPGPGLDVPLPEPERREPEGPPVPPCPDEDD